MSAVTCRNLDTPLGLNVDVGTLAGHCFSQPVHIFLSQISEPCALLCSCWFLHLAWLICKTLFTKGFHKNEILGQDQSMLMYQKGDLGINVFRCVSVEASLGIRNNCDQTNPVFVADNLIDTVHHRLSHLGGDRIEWKYAYSYLQHSFLLLKLKKWMISDNVTMSANYH